MRLVGPELWRNLYGGYKTSWYEVLLGLLDTEFFSHLADEFLLPHYSLTKYQWGKVLMKMKIVIAMSDEGKSLDEGAQTQKERNFELYTLGLQKMELSETPSQSFVVEYSYLKCFSIRYVQISGRRHIKRHGHISPSKVQPFLLV